MKFESLLARRYVTAQKRHSLLTVCSIAIAVALMVALSICFTTLTDINTDVLRYKRPFHLRLETVTKEQGEKIAQLEHIGSCNLTPNPDGETYHADIFFDSYIGDLYGYVDNMRRYLKLETPHNTNHDLLAADRITDQGRYDLAVRFSMFFIFLIFFALALRMLIDTVFEVSAKERERQFGVLQSIGATPKQIRRVLTQEALLLSAAGIPLGSVLGIGAAYLAFRAVLATGYADVMMRAENIAPEIAKQFIRLRINPLMLAGAALIGLMWVFFSAYGTGMRVAKKSPVQTITAREKRVRKVRRHSLSGLLFGWTGMLASRNARREKKRFLITVLALTVSLSLYASVSTVLVLAKDAYMDALDSMQTDSFIGNTGYDFMLELYAEPSGKISADAARKYGLVSTAIPEQPAAYYERVQELENSGYFSEIQYGINKYGKWTDDPDGNTFIAWYTSPAEYAHLNGGEMPLTFEQLTACGGAVLATYDEALYNSAPETVTLDFTQQQEVTMTEAEYEKLTEGISEQDLRKSKDIPKQWVCYGADGKPAEYWYTELKTVQVTYQIAERILLTPDENVNEAGGKPDYSYSYLIMTEPVYRNRDWKQYGELGSSSSVTCRLADGADYEQALQFLEQSDCIRLNHDMYRGRLAADKTVAAYNVGFGFLAVMIALIAIVNMINIVSTGILNRRQEFAALQCSGMTRGQMYRLAMIECMQFTVCAAIAASVLCWLLLRGTSKFMYIMTLTKTDESLISYKVPLIKTWLGSIAVFLVTLPASVLPLHRMQKDSLADQIRSVE